MISATRVRRLSLTNFRSHRAATIEIDAGPVVLVGPNGAGKTNLIEAISFLVPGRGLRRAALEEVSFAEGGASDGTHNGWWAVAAEVEGALGLVTLGTGIEPSGGGEPLLPGSQMPDRSRAGRLSRRLCRSPARRLARSRHGWAVRRAAR